MSSYPNPRGLRSVLFSCLIGLSLLLISVARAEFSAKDWEGKWVLVKSQSSALDVFDTVSLEFKSVSVDRVVINEKWGSRRSHAELLDLKTGGEVNAVPIREKVFTSNVFMGVRREVGATRDIVANWGEGMEVLELEETLPILSSQGKSEIEYYSTISLNADGTVMTWIVRRGTRPVGQKYVLKREGYRDAFYMEMSDNWTMDADLPEQAALITLQGVVNQESPLLYFVYGPKWDFRFTDEIKDYYEAKKQFTFKQLKSFRAALKAFEGKVHNYVVWDKAERTSLIVSFTVAGLEDAIVVSEEFIPLMEESGLKQVADFRGKFTGMSDVEIYQWAYDEYWDRCSKDAIVWMGGDYGRRMRPGVADWGMRLKCFFTDLSTKDNDPKWAEEYAMADKLLSEMNPTLLRERQGTRSREAGFEVCDPHIGSAYFTEYEFQYAGGTLTGLQIPEQSQHRRGEDLQAAAEGLSRGGADGFTRDRRLDATWARFDSLCVAGDAELVVDVALGARDVL